MEASERELREQYKALLQMQLEEVDKVSEFNASFESGSVDLDGFLEAFANPYHDANGRFTTGSSAGKSVASGQSGESSAVGGEMYKNLRAGFSWKTLVGITSLKQTIARKTGIPTTKAGRHRKIQRIVTKAIVPKPFEKFVK